MKGNNSLIIPLIRIYEDLKIKLKAENRSTKQADEQIKKMEDKLI